MFAFLLIVQSLVAISLIGTILMQRSEGGGLAGGGSPAGMMSARGASDFLTRGTSILATIERTYHLKPLDATYHRDARVHDLSHALRAAGIRTR